MVLLPPGAANLKTVPKRNLIWIVAIIAAAAVTALVTRTPPPIIHSNRAAPDPLEGVSRLIRENYARPVDEELLQRGAITGMVGSLDEFSSFVPPGKVSQFQRRLAGMETGLGLRVDMADGNAVVIGPLPGSPAFDARIYSDDRILAIDGLEVSGMTRGQIERLLQGERDAPVKLTLLSVDGQRKTVTIRRQEYALETVQGLCRDEEGNWIYLISPDDGAAYLRIKEFVSRTGRQLQGAMRSASALRGLILDLRGNPGGFRDAALEVADMFLKQGSIVTIVSRSGAETPLAHAEGTYPDLPMVVLIDGGTASAAEIVAGALNYNGRAVLLGTPSRGKRCIQSMIPLDNGLGQINLTTAEFYFGPARPPEGRAWRLQPDELCAMPEASQEKLNRLRNRAEVLLRPHPATRAATHPATAPHRASVEEILELDTQLARAIGLLKHPEAMQEMLKRAAATRAAEASRPAATAPAHRAP